LSIHASSTLSVLLLVYVYRDVVPLAIRGGQPEDVEEGWTLWAKIATTFVAGIVIPLVEPGNTMFPDTSHRIEANSGSAPEYEASWLSLWTYSYLDPFILLSNRSQSIGPEDFTPLPDSERTSPLFNSARPFLDRFSGAPQRHIGFSIIRLFAADFASLVVLVLLKALSGFAVPVATNRLLYYLESNGTESESEVKPWAWIALLFFGPVVGVMAFQAYSFILTRTLVRTEAVLTHLVFEHALRMRVKAETSTTSSTKKERQKTGHFTGMLNSLVTVDMNNILDGRELVIFGKYSVRGFIDAV
jgi:hypothetical protein